MIDKNLQKKIEMRTIDHSTPLWQLTVGEFLSIQNNNPQSKLDTPNNFIYGLKGLAKLLGCSKSKAYLIKKSGILDAAITQNGNHIMIDKYKALELFQNHKKL